MEKEAKQIVKSQKTVSPSGLLAQWIASVAVCSYYYMLLPCSPNFFSIHLPKILSIYSNNNPYFYQFSWIHLISLLIHVFIHYTIQLSNYPFIQRSVHLSTHIFIHPFNHLFIHPSTHSSSHSSIIKLYFPSIDPPIYETILPSFNPKFQPFIQTPIHPFNLDLSVSISIYTFHSLNNLTNQFIHIPIRLYIQTSTHPTMEALIHPYINPFDHSAFNPAIYLSVRPSIHSALPSAMQSSNPSTINLYQNFIYWSMRRTISLYLNRPISPFNPQYFHPSIHPLIHPSNLPFIHLFSYLSINSSITRSIHPSSTYAEIFFIYPFANLFISSISTYQCVIIRIPSSR